MISILRRISFLQPLVQKRLQTQSKFYEQNRQFVLSSYRYLLKTIPTLYPRLLQKKQKLNQLQFIFRSQKTLQTLEQTQFKSAQLKQIVEAVKQNNYEHLGQFQISLYSEADDLTHELKDYNKKYTLDKRTF